MPDGRLDGARRRAAVPDRLTSFYRMVSPSLDDILGALSAAGVDPARTRAQDLYTRDLDCHNLGMHRMLETVAGIMEEYATVGPGDIVLDLGCGMGGPGRFLADRFGCAVTGVDLLPIRVDVAEALTELTGQGGRVTYRVADATSLPFTGGSFDHVWMLDVAIHVRDKVALFSEIARVVRPGGLLVMHDMTGPLPRSMRPLRRRAPYFAPSLPQLLRYVETAGLRVLTWRDTSPSVLDYFLGIRRLLPEPTGPRSSRREQTSRRALELLDAYVETLRDPAGRTGILVARRAW